MYIPSVAIASHFVLSHTFNWRQSNIYDPALAEQLRSGGVTDIDIATLQSLLKDPIWKILSTRWVFTRGSATRICCRFT